MRTKFLQPKTTQIACFNDNVIVNAKVFSRSVMKVLFLIIALLFMQNLQAAYLRNIPVTKTQPDGTVLHCYASGDEYFNYLHDADGYTIIQNPITGYYVYADKRAGKLVATDYVAGRYKPESKGLKPYNIISPEEWMERRRLKDRYNERHRNSGLNHGTLNNIAVFIRFADDDEFTSSYSSIDNMFNDESQNAVSMTNYFKSASYNDLTISTTFYPMHNGEVIVSYQDIKNRCYYQPQNGLNSEGYANESEANQREFDLLERAINYVKNLIPNNLDIDHDNDGYVDNVCFIVKGYPDGWNDLLWPHQYYLLNNTVTINGKRVYSYNFQLSEGSSFNTSTMCHEMNHSLGAPDLYHYSNMSVSGPDPVFSWDLMNYNITPPQHCGAYMKWQYGDWIDVIPEIEPGTYTLNPISSPTPDNIAYKISTLDPNQFYVLEYRNTNTPFESALPGSGLLIYRIDTRFCGNSYYDPSNGAYDEVYIFRPNGTYSAEGDIDMANFSFDSGRTEFSNSTSPYPFSSEGIIDNNIRIYNITGAGNTITFTYESLVQCDAPTNLSASLSGRTVTLSWTAAEGVSSYRIYRNDELIASNATGTSYTDSYLGVGQYNYYLRSNCSDGSISDISSVVVVDMPFYGDETVTIGDLLYLLDLVTHEAEVIGHDDGTSATGSLVIPSSVVYQANSYVVKSIGYGAFWGCHGFTGSLIIPNSVITIGDEAFWGCSGLTSVTIGNSVTSIGGYAFRSCTSLHNVYWNAVNVTSYPYDCYNPFENCTQLTTIIFGNTAQTIPNCAFYDCSGLTSVTIPNSVITIGDEAFWGCNGLTSVTIGTSVTSIGGRAFKNCSNLHNVYWNAVNVTGYPDDSYNPFENCTQLTTVVFGNLVQTIPDNAFYDCSGLTTVTIGNSVTTIGTSAFRYCTNLNTVYWNALNVTNYPLYYYDCPFAACTKLSTVIFGSSVQTIPAAAFIDCSGLVSVTLPNSVTTIGSGAFRGCSGLTSVTIPNSVTTIPDNAFSGCSSLTSITIPNSVTMIGAWSFRDCTNLSTVYWNALNVANYQHGSYNPFDECTNLSSVVFGNLVETIPEWAFKDFSSITTVTIGNSVTTIGEWAFSNCTNLNTVYWNAVNVTNYPVHLDDNPFYQCTNLSSVVFGNLVETIPEIAFEDFSSITTVTIGNSVTTIGTSAFSGCSGLTSMTIPNSVTTIGNAAFAGTGMISMTIPISVTAIGDGAFYGCSGLTSLTIGNSVTTIGNNCFSNCTNLNTVYWNAINVTGYPIGSNHPFGGCSKLVTVVFGNLVETIPEWAFEGFSSITTVTIGNSVVTVGKAAFYGCNGLATVYYTGTITQWCNIDFESNPSNPIRRAQDFYIGGVLVRDLVIPSDVEVIKDFAFFAYSGLTSVTIENSVTTIGGGVFSHCSGLTSVTIPNSVTTIGAVAFSDCSGLTSVNYTGTISQWCGIIFANHDSNPCFYSHNLFINGTPITDLNIPSDVEIIGDYAFAGCSSLISVTVGNSVITIGDSAFYNCSGLVSVTIGNSVTTIGDSAFRGCSSLIGPLTIPNSVTTIGSQAFYELSGLSSVTIGNSVTTIGTWAFCLCSGLTSLTIGNSISTIGYQVFAGCSGLKAIRSECTIPPILDQSAFIGVDKSILVFVPCDTKDDYKNTDYWSEFENINESPYDIILTKNNKDGGVVSVVEYANCNNNHCAILAVPNIGYAFDGWWVDDEKVSSDPLCDFSLVDDITFMAKFERLEYHEVATDASTIWSNPITWDNGEVPDATSTVAIRNNVTVDIDAIVEALGVYDNSVLTIQSGVTLIINDTLGSIKESSIIIEDGGQLIHSSNDALATLNKSIDGYTSDDDGWNLVSFPLTGIGTIASVENMLSCQYDLYYYDEPSYTWINQKDGSNGFTDYEAGKGYLYANNSGAIYPLGKCVGEGTYDSYYAPLYTSYKYTLSEILYLSSELDAVDMPTTSLGSLCWYATNTTGYKQSSISIWMANVNDNTVGYTSHNVNDMTLVYTGDMTPVVGWNEFVFNENTFTWDGISNVLISIQRNNGECNDVVNWQSHSALGVVSFIYNNNNPYGMTNETYSMYGSYARPNTAFQTTTQAGNSPIVPVTISYAGEIENGTAEVTVPLSYTGGNKLSGFNLVGNPFVHNVTSYETTNVADGCFRVNDTKTNLIVSTISNENPLKPAEGFFVKATGDNASVTFNSSSKRYAEDKGSITMEIVQNEKIIDRFMIKEDGDNLNKISLRGNHTEIYAKSDGHKLALVPLKGNEQAVNFKSADMGMYAINVAMENMDLSYLHLVDNITGANVDLLRNPSYSFYASASDNESRFRLIFDPSVSPGNNDVFVYQDGDDIIVNGNGDLQVFDVMGRMIATQRVTGAESLSKPSQDGVYIYRLINGNDVQTQKIVVR